MNSRIAKLIGIGILVIGLFGNAFGQSGGANTPQNKNTDNGSDQNLKSSVRINPSTLAMEMSLPLASYPGRNGSSLPVGVSYSSKLWRMKDSEPYFYNTPIGNYRQYVTQLHPTFAERSAAGWTSSIAFPVIEEKLEIFTQQGDIFNFALYRSTFNERAEAIINASNQTPDNAQAPGANCARCTFSMIGADNETHCLSWYYWNSGSDSCGGGGGGGGGCGTWCDIEPVIPNNQPPPKMHYVKRVHVRMGDGSTIEFRKSDAAFGYCVGGNDDGPNCEGEVDGYVDNIGMFLSVDASGMKLERTTTGSTLFMPNGSRYLFPSNSTGTFQESVLYQSNEYIDVDGNRSQFTKDATTNIRTVKDTLNREVNDFLPQNYNNQEQTEGIKQLDLPTKSGQSLQHYEFKWLHLKPVSGGIQEGALENQAENVYFYGSVICMGAPEPSIYPNAPGNPIPTDIMFPYGGIGLRSCNPGSTVATAKRFNPVVLAEVKLPNGKTYEFKYNQFGEITKITYPTGSYETFTYNRISPLNPSGQAFDQTNRGVTERRVYRKSDGNADVLEQRWQYSATASSGSYKVTTIAPKADNPMDNGIKTERFLQSTHTTETNFGFQNPLEGMPYEERTYDENGKLRSRTLTEYGTKGPVPTNDPLRPANGVAFRDPRPTRSISISYDPPPTVTASTFASLPDPDDEGGGGCTSGCGGGGTTTIPGNVLATMSSTEYDSGGGSDPEYFSHLNVKSSKSYHYTVIPANIGLTAALQILSTYFTSTKLSANSQNDYDYNSPNYLKRGIIGLKTESRLLDENNSVIGKTQTVFDESTYLVPDSGSLTGSLSATWVNPNTDLSIPIESRMVRAKPTTSRVWNKTTGSWIETHMQFDQYGNVRKTIDPIGNVTQTEYSSEYGFAYPTHAISPPPDPESSGHGTSNESHSFMTYDYATGLPVTVTDDFGKTIKTDYNDPLLRPTKVSGINIAIPVTETIYSDNDGTVTIRKMLDEENWDEAIIFSDTLGRKTKTIAKDSQGDIIVETKYDTLGRVLKTSNPYRFGDDIYWMATKYDEQNRLVETFTPAKEGEPQIGLGISKTGISTVPNFVGVYSIATDASGRKSRRISDALSRIIRSDESTSSTGSDDVQLGSLESPHQSTSYEYNAIGKLIHVQQGNLGETVIQHRYFLYNNFGLLIRARQPEHVINSALNTIEAVSGNNQWTTSMEYDVVGNLTKTIDAEGRTTTNEYDKAGRVKVRTYSDLDTPSVYYYYDGFGLSTPPPATNNFAKGKLTKVMSSISTTQYTSFDNFGRTLTSQQITDGQTYESEYKYDFGGRLVEQTYPSGKVVRNFFESDGDLAKVVKNGKVLISNFDYTASGGIRSLKLGNGRFETAEFNTRRQPTQIGLGSTTTANDLWKVNYSYGELAANGVDVIDSKNTGNIAKQVITAPNATFTQTYRYDSLDRITEAKETAANNATTWQQSWNYDRFGNRLSFNSSGINLATINTTPAVNPETNRFTSTQDFGYDKTGNVIKDKVNGNLRNFVFNGDNKQVHVKDANNNPIGTYYYDGNGARVKKSVDGNTTIFVYDAAETLVAEYSTETPTANPTTSYTTTDHLGSPRVITDKNGNVTSRRDFMPFGEELNADATYRTSANKYSQFGTDNIRKRFAGYEKDDETNLDFAEARYYNNKHGRFTAVDPLLASGNSSNPQTFNRYVYVGNNPVNVVDPTGTDWYFNPNGKINYQWFNIAPTEKGWMRLNGYMDSISFTCYCRLNGKLGWVAIDPLANIAKGGFTRQSDAAKYFITSKMILQARDFADGMSSALNPTSDYIRKVFNYFGLGTDTNNSSPDNVAGQITGAIIGVLAGSAASAPAKLKPLNGIIDVGGKTAEGATNVNLAVEMSEKGIETIANLVKADGSNIGEIFEAGSAGLVMSVKVIAKNFNIPKLASGAFEVLKDGGKVTMNFWTYSKEEVTALKIAFQNAGFKDVVVVGSGTNTWVYAIR